MRHRRAIAISAACALVLLFAFHAYHWHFPYRRLGAFGEWPLLAAAAVFGAAGAWAVPAYWRRLTGARAAVGAVAALSAFVGLQTADPFAGERTWRYAPAGCDFAVAFPRRPQVMGGEVQLAGVSAKTVPRAVHIDVGDAMALSAECVDFGAGTDEAARSALLAAAEAQLKSAATRFKLKIDRLAREGDAIVLAGTSGEGRTESNDVLIRRGEARAVLGKSSLLILWTWTTGRGAASRVPATDNFLASVTPSRAAR